MGFIWRAYCAMDNIYHNISYLVEKKMQPILTPNAPAPGGHYAQAIVHGDFVFVAGQLPIDPVTGEKCLGEIEEQTLLTLRNLEAILVAAGSDLNKVIKTTVFISDISLWGRVNTVYAQFFGDWRPARSVVPVSELHYGFKIEIEAVAAL